MPRDNTGYVYRSKDLFAVVKANGQTIKRRARSKKHAQELINSIKSKLTGPPDSAKIVTEKGLWIARVTYTDDFNKLRTSKRTAESKTDAKQLLKSMTRQIDDLGTRALESSQMTVVQAVDHYEQTYAGEPEYHDGRKIAGLRSYKSVRTRLKAIRAFFGKMKLNAVSHEDIERYKQMRLKTPVVRGICKTTKSETKGKPVESKRSVASVNRELTVMRRIFNIAVKRGWIVRNPFAAGDSLISPGDERSRERILSREEEHKLLAACVDRREHLRPILIAALDTGMRRGELLKLKWSDVNFDMKQITVQAFNSKTMKERKVPLTKRLAIELKKLEGTVEDPNNPVFRVADIKKAFNAAKEKAEISDFTFHDLRHTTASRLVASQMPLAEVARILGHSSIEMTYRYVNADDSTIEKAMKLLNEFNN